MGPSGNNSGVWNISSDDWFDNYEKIFESEFGFYRDSYKLIFSWGVTHAEFNWDEFLQKQEFYKIEHIQINETMNIAAPASQTYLIEFCDDVDKIIEVVPQDWCFMRQFKAWVEKEKGVSYPI